MKKNRMMRAASALLVAVLLTTCTISGTFAKYVTEAESQDSARVAYWGFNATTFSIEDLFSKSYTAEGNKVLGSADVIAPGTTNSATFSFKPQNATAPEVAYKITVDTKGSTIDEDLVENTNIQWKLNDGAWGTFAEMRTAIEALSTDDTVPAGQFDESWGATSTHTVSWQWLINEVSDANDAQNVKDTALGNKTDLDWVTLVINIRAEQVD